MADGVTPTERCLDVPPSADEGEVRKVEFGRTDDRHLIVWAKECQQCSEPVAYEEPHVWVFGWHSHDGNQTTFRAMFCDRACWTSWASRSD